MRRIVTAACLVLCASCSSGPPHEGASAGGSCTARITWHGAVYYGERFPSRLPATLALGIGGRPTCKDSNGGEAGASTAVEVRRLAGVDPRVAVAVRGEREHAYLAAGYFLELPSHPLHGAIEWSRRSSNELIGCARSPEMRIEGTIRYGPSPLLEVSGRDRVARRYVGSEALLFVDARTRVERLSRNGLPYVAQGTEVAVDAVGCLARDGTLAKLVPRRIAPA